MIFVDVATAAAAVVRVVSDILVIALPADVMKAIRAGMLDCTGFQDPKLYTRNNKPIKALCRHTDAPTALLVPQLCTSA